MCNAWLPAETEWMIACDPCALDWPELHGEFGAMVMKERCGIPLAATGFRLRTRSELKAQLGVIKYGGTRRLAKQRGYWLGHRVPRPASLDLPLVLVPAPLNWRKQWKRGENKPNAFYGACRRRGVARSLHLHSSAFATTAA